jgi:carbon storage regulator
MLVLTRRVGERIVIADDIVVTIVKLNGKQIRVAIEAPPDVRVYRGEIYERIVAEREAVMLAMPVEE